MLTSSSILLKVWQSLLLKTNNDKGEDNNNDKDNED